eukprot:Lithocolla_globosa_v1_NODE_1602_length_2456_cov_9.681383.p2 type:complete len:134 gc:universal NODE_1602_length_2456_cov_9.681383:667-266(-)
MIFTSMVVAFCGFFRFDDLSNLELSTSQFFPTPMLLFIISSKTDQYCHGSWVAIARNGTVCPLTLLKAVITRGNVISGTFLRRVTRTKNGAFLSEILPVSNSISSSINQSWYRRKGCSRVWYTLLQDRRCFCS